MGNNRIYWTCPYYRGDDKKTVRCEGGSVSLPDRAAEREYIRAYCADHLGWRRCTVARAVTRIYEAREEEF